MALRHFQNRLRVLNEAQALYTNEHARKMFVDAYDDMTRAGLNHETSLQLTKEYMKNARNHHTENRAFEAAFQQALNHGAHTGNNSFLMHPVTHGDMIELQRGANAEARERVKHARPLEFTKGIYARNHHTGNTAFQQALNHGAHPGTELQLVHDELRRRGRWPQHFARQIKKARAWATGKFRRSSF